MTRDLRTEEENTWCPGCGNFGILNAVKKAVANLEERGVSSDSLVCVGGIGCHGKIVDYVNLSTLYAIHGRGTACGQGIKLANPDLTVLVFSGDGDAYGEGIAHTVFAAKRNAGITLIVHDNGVYALTTGQFSPTSAVGFKGPSLPQGSFEPPLNPLALLLQAGASFVARGYAGRIDHLASLIVEGALHPGFSLIDVLQPSVVFNNTYKEFNERVTLLKEPASSVEEAIALVQNLSKGLPIGIFYRKEKPVYHKSLFGDFNPVTKKVPKEVRREPLRKMVQPLQQSLPAAQSP